MRTRLRVSAIASAALLTWVPGVASAGASVHLVYVRGPGAEACPQEDALRAAVGTRLGYDPFFGWARETLFAEITRTDDTFSASVKLVDEKNSLEGARSLSVRGDDCTAVINALGLTISLAIDPASVIGPPVAPPAPEATPEAPKVRPPAPPPPEPILAPDAPAPPAPAARRSDNRFFAGLGALGSLGAAPNSSAGANLFAGLSSERWSLELDVRTDLPATGPSDVHPQRVTSWLFAGAIVPCVRFGVSFGCAVGTAGALGATSTAVTHDTAYGPWWAAGPRLGADLPFSPSVILRVYGEFLTTFARNSLWINGTQEYRFAPFSGGLGVALAWRFR